MKRKFLTFAFILIGLFLASCGGRQVTINFDVQGGVPISAIEITQLTEIEEPTPVREGYTFLGWYTEETYENLFDFEEGATRNITLYAQWEINEYTISFETYNDTTIDPITANYQTTISIPSNLVKEGFTFGGWYQDAEFTTRFEGTRMGASDLTLHAYWAPIYYTVEFYADSELVDTVPVQHGELIEDIPAIPIKEGYDSSWDFNENTPITSNMTINAIYVLKTYTVTFVDQAGNLYHTETVNHGEKAIGPETDPSKLGYTFVGYSEDLSTFIVEEDTEITVLFSPVAYLVTFRVQGMQVKSEEVIYGQDATPPTVTVDGYTFVEWDVDFTNVTSNLEVNAILEANNYNITLHGNGGVFAGEETTDIVSAPYESSVNYSTQPTRLGYQFGGWYLNAEGTGNPINLVNYTMPLNGVELYAKWNLVTYTITYNDLFGSQTSNKVSYNVTDTFTLTNPTSRTGYSFVGWFDAQTDGNQVTTIDAGTTGNLSLYARWLANEYTITFDTSGGEAILPLTVTYDQPFTLPDAVKTGYTFIEWQREGVAFVDGTWNIDQNITLVAVYEANKYTITFDVVGGEAISPLTVTYDQPFTLPSAVKNGYTFVEWQKDGVTFANGTWTLIEDITLVADYSLNDYTITYSNLNSQTHSNPDTYTILSPTIPLTDPLSRTGYTFVGWFDTLTGGNEVTEITTGSTGDITIYARWEANDYTITFDVAGGEAIAPLAVTYDQAFVLPDAVRTGYTFAGWQYNLANFVDGIWAIDQDITLVALWTEWPVINFVENGGTSVSNISLAPGTVITEPVDPTRTGYTFAGWFEDDVTFLTEYVFSTMPSSDLTLYAKWTPVEYNITYENLFTQTHSNPATYTIETPTITLTDPTTLRTGYNFVGWFDALSGGNEVTEITLGSYGDKTLYARWQPIIYSITYENLNGGTNANATTYTIESSNLTLTDAVLEGYTFVGWFDALSGGNEVTEITTGSTGDVTIYARWEANVYNIYFNLNGGSGVALMLVTYDDTFTLPVPTKENYTFVEWQYNGQTFVEGTYTIASDITLNAIYVGNPMTITYDTGGGVAMDPDVVPYNSTLAVPSVPVREGYTFLAWYSDIELANIYDFNDPVTSSFTLYAAWQLDFYTWEVEANFTILDDIYNPTGPIADPNQLPITTTYINLYYGQEMSPIQVFEGYEFDYFVYDGLTYNSLEQLITVTGNRTGIDKIQVFYKKIVLEITFAQDPDLFLPEVSLWTGTGMGVVTDSEIIITYVDTPTNWSSVYVQGEITDFDSYFEAIVFTITGEAGQTYVFKISNGDAIYREIIHVASGLQEQVIIDLSSLTEPERDALIQIKIYSSIAGQTGTLVLHNVEPIVTYRVYYNETFLIGDAPTLVVPSGFTVVWDRTQFTNIREDIIVYAIYYQVGVDTVTFISDGVIKYIAVQIESDPLEPNYTNDVIGTESLLWDLYKPGYVFMGWFTEPNGQGTKIIEGNLLFSDFGTTYPSLTLPINLYAYWVELTPFDAPTNIVVVADETEIVISWTIDPATINGSQPTDFEFMLNNELITGMTTFIALSGTTFTLTLPATDPDYALFSDLLEPGTHEISIRAIGDEINNYHSEMSDIYEYSLESIFTGDPTGVAVYDYFIIETYGETKRYIFYTNLEYQFNSTYTFEIVTGNEFANALNNTISTNSLSGSFKFRMIRDDETVVYDALVVHDIKQFEHGNNYRNFLDAQVANQTAFLDQATTYYYGSGSEFYLDIRMINNQGTRIPISQTLLEYELYENVGGTYQLIDEINLINYLELLPNNQLLLKPATVGGTFKIVVQPKYQATSMIVAPLEYIFTVNDGVNVFNNLELKAAFANFNVNTINIHASFKAELTTEQMNADGSPMNRRPSPANPLTGNIYQRYSTSIDDDYLTIEGNFMTIDGSQLPFSNSGSDPDGIYTVVGFAEAFEVVNVQIGIFFYGVRNTALTDNINNNQFVMNNLIVKGNTSTPYVDFGGTAEEIEIQERLMSRDSGGFTGIITANGSVDMNNLVIFNTVIAVTNNAYGYKSDGLGSVDYNAPTYVNLDYSKIYNNWANSLYISVGLGFTLYNSEIGQSGGAAIHLVDTHPAEFDESYIEIRDPNPYLYLDSSTSIDNWVSGEEAWFKAYAMSQTALQLKGGIETGIAPVERSIINLMTDPISGLETEKINFILLTEPFSTAKKMLPPNNVQKISGSEVVVNIDGYEIYRPFDFLDSGDPRISGGQFAFPIGAYSEWNAFYSLIQDITAMIAPMYPVGTPSEIIQEDAQNLAQLGSFYGLTAAETVNAYGYSDAYSTTFREAVFILMPTHVLPKYIEVLAPVPLFDSGYSVVIIEFSE